MACDATDSSHGKRRITNWSFQTRGFGRVDSVPGDDGIRDDGLGADERTAGSLLFAVLTAT